MAQGFKQTCTCSVGSHCNDVKAPKFLTIVVTLDVIDVPCGRVGDTFPPQRSQWPIVVSLVLFAKKPCDLVKGTSLNACW